MDGPDCEGLRWTWLDAFDITEYSDSKEYSSTTSRHTTENKARHPIAILKHLAGRPRADINSPLFALLPLELLIQILALLPTDTLTNFAFVSRGCYQLARPFLLEKLIMDFSNSRFDTLLRLVSEAQCALGAPSEQTTVSRLGPFIRQLIVHTKRSNIEQRMGVSYYSIFFAEGEEQRSRMQSVADFYFGAYIPLLTFVIKNSLPNLDLLHWRDWVRMEPKLLDTILRSSIKHLKLDKIPFDMEQIDAFRAIQPTQFDNLETLHIELQAGRTGDKPLGHALDLLAQILKYCSSSLSTLNFRQCAYHLEREPGHSEPLPCLRNLRDLSLDKVSIRSIADLESLLVSGPDSKLVRLQLEYTGELTMDYMRTLGHLPNLKKLVNSVRYHEEGVPVSFLRENPQLELLSLESCHPVEFRCQILPLLAQRFHNLKSLEISYDDGLTAIWSLALGCITDLKNLEKLHLRAGLISGPKRLWLVDHVAIRRCVRQLPRLKYLALSRDTYQSGSQRGDGGAYYRKPGLVEAMDEAEARLLRQGDHEPRQQRFSEDSQAKFELVHRRRMLLEANKYVRLRYKGGPALEYMYFGQLSIEVKCGWYGYRAVAASGRRDQWAPFLKRMFWDPSITFNI